MSVLDFAKKIHEDDTRSIDKVEFRYCITFFDTLSEREKTEISAILLDEVCYLHNVLKLQDLFKLKKYVSFNKLCDDLCTLLLFSYENGRKHPIFSDTTLQKIVAHYLKSKKRYEYYVLLTLYNNGYGDKKEIKEYLDEVGIKPFYYSQSWLTLYKQAKKYVNKKDEA